MMPRPIEEMTWRQIGALDKESPDWIESVMKMPDEELAQFRMFLIGRLFDRDGKERIWLIGVEEVIRRRYLQKKRDAEFKQELMMMRDIDVNRLRSDFTNTMAVYKDLVLVLEAERKYKIVVEEVARRRKLKESQKRIK